MVTGEEVEKGYFYPIDVIFNEGGFEVEGIPIIFT